MTLRAIFGRRWVQCLGLVGAASAGYVFGITADRAAAQAPQPLPQPDKRIVAYIYGSVPVTREDLGEFLIARGGYDKLDLLVNKKIIEVEAARRNMSVTDTEVRAALEDDLRGMNMKMDDFTKHILPRYGKTLYEWTEDVIKPRLMLTKMCRDRVKVTEDDLKRLFENKYGEQRQAKLICWPKAEEKIALKQWEEARKGDVEFDSIARRQGDPNLAAAAGLTAPVGRNAFEDTEGRDASVEKVLFTLKEGEMSQLFQVSAGVMCVKCVKIIPPNATVTMDKVRETLQKEVFDRKLSAEIPEFFKHLKKVADPQVYLKGPPSAKEFLDRTKEIMQTSGLTPAGPTHGPAPMTPVPVPKMP
jgi:hypothetical protein